MPNNMQTARKLGRWAGLTVVLGGLIFWLAGEWSNPWLWAYMAVFAAAGLFAALGLDDDLLRERFRPPEAGADKAALTAIRVIALLHLIVGALDGGRWRIAVVPDALRTAGVVGMAAGLLVMFSAMRTNRFFSPVVRIQRERGHELVDRGLYAIVRHPGYVGMLTIVPFGALALGSWLGFAFACAYALLLIRRVVFEDGFLRANLSGYESYAARVRYRLVPGVW